MKMTLKIVLKIFKKKIGCDISVLALDRSVSGVHSLVDAWRYCAVTQRIKRGNNV